MALTLTMSVALTACSEKTDGNNGSSPTDSSKDISKTNGEVVTITYGGWEKQLMALELAEKFNARNPNIKVEIFNNGKWLNNAELTQLAATNQMPDIVNIENIVIPIQNKWVADMTEFYEKDPEATSLPQNFLEYGKVNDKLVMLPGALYLFGVMVNLDLLSANGIEAPGYDWTIDQFSDILKQTTKRGSTIGTNYVEPLMAHIPAQMNSELGWGAFNETTKKYNLGAEWEKGIQTTKDLLEANVSVWEHIDALGLPWELEEGSAEQSDLNKKRDDLAVDIVGEADTNNAWYKGKAGTWLDFTYSTGFESNENYAGFEWDFYPLPIAGDIKESRTPFVLDSVAITSNCKNKEAAYEFVKYLSYSKEGIEDRMQIVKEYDKEALKAKYPNLPETEFELPLTFSQMPVTTDKEVIAKWAEFTNAKPGISYMLERLDSGYADGFKVTPGYNDAYGLTIEKAVREQVFTGQKTAADLAKELEEKANKITEDAYAVLK